MGTAFLFCLPYHGHINPCVPVVQELIRRGERVVIYTTEEFRPMLASIGAEFREFPYEESNKGSTLLTMAYWQLQVTSRSMDMLVRHARAYHVTYILVDYLCHWGHTLAKHLSLPLVVLHSTYPAAFRDVSLFRSVMLDLQKAPYLLPRLLRFILLDRRLARHWGVMPLRLPIGLVRRREGGIHIVLTSEWIQPQATLGQHPYHFVGSCVRRQGTTQGERLPALDGRPLIYISLGTFWNDKPDFYRTCAQVFGNGPYQVLISVGSAVLTAGLGPLPQNIHIRGHVDQIEALEHASLFISHGGMNSLCEAVQARVPLLLLPQAGDQFPLSELMQQKGVGIVLQPGTVSADTLRAAAERALRDGSIKAKMTQLRSMTAAHGDPGRRAADLIFELLLTADRAGNNSPPHRAGHDGTLTSAGA